MVSKWNIYLNEILWTYYEDLFSHIRYMIYFSYNFYNIQNKLYCFCIIY